MVAGGCEWQRAKITNEAIQMQQGATSDWILIYLWVLFTKQDCNLLVRYCAGVKTFVKNLTMDAILIWNPWIIEFSRPMRKLRRAKWQEAVSFLVLSKISRINFRFPINECWNTKRGVILILKWCSIDMWCARYSWKKHES